MIYKPCSWLPLQRKISKWFFVKDKDFKVIENSTLYFIHHDIYYLQATTALLLQMSRPSSSVQRAPTVLRGHPAPPHAQRAHSPT